MARARAFKLIPRTTKHIVMYKIDELVMCESCKYWRRLLLNADGDGVCRADNAIKVTHPDWFCADGRPVKCE